MVSRGGRSKGCSNCRRRRVKCDETRPVCNRCKKRGLECDGPKDPTWINQNNAFPVSHPAPDAVVLAGDVPGSLSFAAFEDDLCLAYTRKHLLRGGSVELACDMIRWQSGADEDMINPGLALLRNAVLSLSVTFFGSQTRQKTITNRGYRQYGEVLKQLNSHLAQPGLQVANETILTALTCMLLEIFLPTAPNNFLTHIRGIEAMLQIRGPPISETGDSASIFHGLRILSIIGALSQGRPSVWAEPDWKQVPPLHTNESCVIRHEIFKVLADCTVYMRERDRLSACHEGLQHYRPLLDSLNTLFERLKTIYPRWESHNESLMSERASILDKQVKIADHASATTFMLYNTAYLCVLRIINTIDPSPKYMSLRNAAAIKIVRCLDQKEFEKREGNAESNTIGFVATKVAWEALGGFTSPEGRKLARIVKSAANGTFAVGAWEDWEDQKPKRSFTDLGADKTLWEMWNQPFFQPMWSEHQSVGKPELNSLTRREIINVGARPASPPGRPSFPFQMSSQMSSIPFYSAELSTTTPFPALHESQKAMFFKDSTYERRKKAESFLTMQQQAQSSEIVNHIQGVLANGFDMNPQGNPMILKTPNMISVHESSETPS